MATTDAAHDGAGPDSPAFWLTRLVTRLPGADTHPVRAVVSGVGVPPVLVLLAYVASRFEYLEPGFLLSLAFVACFYLVAPLLVWYYDARLLPAFFDEIQAVVESPEVVTAVRETARRRLTRYWWVPALVTVPTIPALLFGGRSFVRAQGLFGPTDPLFWLVGVILVWAAILVAIGFAVIATTVTIVRRVATADLTIDPLHPDGLGGMSTVGDLSIRTTVLAATGSLLLPLQFQYAATTDPIVTGIIYFNGLVYAGAIGAVFVYPTFHINRRANAIRERILDDLRTQYRELKAQSAEPVIGASLDSTDDALEVKLQRVRKEYEDYNQVRLYPMEFSIFVRLVGSVLLPVFLIVLDTLLRPTVLEQLLDLQL